MIVQFKVQTNSETSSQGSALCSKLSVSRFIISPLSKIIFRTFFKGKKDLFKGLYVYDQDWDWEEYPIIKLDFNEIENYNNNIFYFSFYYLKILPSLPQEY